jgi:hypothetical protein
VRHEGTAQAIIDLFDPHGDAPRSQLQTSLHRLSRMLDVDVESAREGVVNLLLDGDFTASMTSPTLPSTRSSNCKRTGISFIAPASPSIERPDQASSRPGQLARMLTRC